MPTKLKIKMGHIEFEYEGDAPYDTQAVKDLFTHIEALMNAAPVGAFETPPSNEADGEYVDDVVSSELGSLAPNTIAARLDSKSGTQLVIAAAAHIQICLGKPSFSRAELHSTMKSATSYYQAGMSGNLSKMLKTLGANRRINNLSGGQLSLAANELHSLKAKIARP